MTPERRCPECTGPNEFLEYEGVEPAPGVEPTPAPDAVDAVVAGSPALPWTWSPDGMFLHRYRCTRCGHVIEWRSNFRDPTHL